MSLEITKENFLEEVINATVPVMLDFWAEWCGPCKMVGPIIEEIANEVGETAKVGKVNVDKEIELAQKFGVVSIPTIIIFNEGVVTNTVVGFRDKAELMSLIGQ